MKKNFLLILSLMILGLTYSHLFAEDKNSPKEILINTWQRIDFQLALEDYFMVNFENNQSKFNMNHPGTKSIAKAILFSTAIPGMGEFYSGSYLKGIIFLAIEAAAWPGYFHFHNRGEDIEAAFERYAIQNWDPDAYWDWISERSGISRTDMDALREFERDHFSHFLPEEKNQQYYENIGKYDQFNIGWVDTENGDKRDSELREKYTLMRKDANDNFKRATNMATILLFNHVFSALDAAWTTNRHNKQIISASLKMKSMQYGNEILPALALRVSW